MKKIIRYFLLIFLLVIGINRVNASTYEGKLYEVWHPNSGFTVFAEETNRYMDYNSWMIKSTTDDKVYYCIDPATPLEGSSEKSHNLYTNRDEILKNTTLTEETFKKVQLLSYYGYGYKDDKIDHTNKKWYGITQVMIWRTVRPDLKWVFKKDRNSTPDPSLYINEVAELNKLVNDYEKTPSLSGKEIKLIRGTKIEIEDTNKTLYKYSAFGTNTKLDIELKENKMTISSDAAPGAYYTSFWIKPYTNDRFGALVSSDFQDVIRLGAPSQKVFGITVNITGGIINLQKQDETTKENKAQGEATLENAIYEVKDEKNNVIGKIKTNKEGKGKISLDYGKYKITELQAPKGYNLNEKTYEVELTEENNEIDLNTTDKVIQGKILLTKKKGGSGEPYTKEQDATFEIIDQNNNVVEELITNENGIAITYLPYGTYRLHQTKGEEGYVFQEDIPIEIKEEKIYEIEAKNERLSKLEITKKDSSTNKVIPNTLIQVYKDNDELICEYKTDKNGKITVQNLEIGSYYIIEKEPAKYYRLNKEKTPFEIKENGKTIKINIENQKKEGRLIIVKKDYETGKRLKDAIINIYEYNNKKPLFKGKTNEKGEININPLKAGKYCIEEIKAPKGYKRTKDKRCFEITEDSQIVKVIIKNKKNEIKVPKTSLFKIIPIIGTLLVVISTSYLIYEKNS